MDRLLPKAGVLAVAIIIMIIATALLACANSSGEPEEPEPEETNLIEEDDLILGTLVTLKVHADRDPEILRDQVREVMDEMQQRGCRLSVYCPDSETRRVNASAGEPVEVSDEFYELLEYGLEVAERSDGVFDPTVGPLVDLWGFYTEEHRVPDEEEIEEALKLVDWRDVELSEGTVTLKPGMRLDLESLLKGLIADHAADRLREMDVSGALIISGSSTIAVIGESDSGRPWRIGLEHPRRPGDIYAALEVHDGEHVSTSGDYQRYFVDDDGVRYSHILNANTGRPVEKIIAATVVSGSSLRSDGISTAAMGCEPDEAISFIQSGGESDGLVITGDEEILYTDDMDARVELLDGGL
ncbi:MAG: FAD:protein FMN transferase [Clostridia bacterium]